MPDASKTVRVSLAIAAVALLALSGCRADEQDRPLSFTPHQYGGDKLPALTDQQKRNLQERGTLQR